MKTLRKIIVATSLLLPFAAFAGPADAPPQHASPELVPECTLAPRAPAPLQPVPFLRVAADRLACQGGPRAS